MWQPEALGPYVRMGRFFAPYGLRFAEHVLYVRRDLGFDQLRETYNLSAGYTVRSGSCTSRRSRPTSFATSAATRRASPAITNAGC